MEMAKFGAQRILRSLKSKILWPSTYQGLTSEGCWDSCGGAQAKLSLVGVFMDGLGFICLVFLR